MVAGKRTAQWESFPQQIEQPSRKQKSGGKIALVNAMTQSAASAAPLTQNNCLQVSSVASQQSVKQVPVTLTPVQHQADLKDATALLGSSTTSVTQGKENTLNL